MARLSEFKKDPEAVLDYKLDLSAWLSAAELVTSASVIADAGLTVDSSTFAGDSVTAWLSGGVEDKKYEVTFHWSTNQGRTDERSILVLVRHQ